MTGPFDPNHFAQDDDGGLRPQPWMQWRQLDSVGAKSKTGTYNVTGGGNKDDLLHSLNRRWRNDTPVPQNVYGLITRGGCRVTLQARSRGGLVVRSGYRREHILIDDSFETLDPRWTFATTHSRNQAVASAAGGWRMEIGPAAAVATSVFANSVPVNPGDKVRVTYQVRRDAAFNATDPGTTKISLRKQDGGEVATLPFNGSQMANAQQWYPRTVLYTVPADGSVTSLAVRVMSSNTAGYAWLDTLRVIVSPEGDPDLPLALTDSSYFGVGGDLGRGGVLAVGTTFAMPEVRMNAVTFPVAPERVGLARVDPGEDFVAAAELRFITQQWEYTTIDGGDSESESGYVTGDTRLDLFALPIIT